MNPYISIIIPTINSEKTVKDCLKSILNQTFPNFEILIIDGGSVDNTLLIALEFNDSRIRVHSEPDEGIYYAMNKGIMLAKGEWVYFLGSDDRLYTNIIIDNIVKYFSLVKYDVIYGNVTSTRFGGVYAGEFDFKKLYNQNICHQAIFFNKKLFNKVGLFNTKYLSKADYDHNIRWFLNKKIEKLYVEDIIAEYADGGYSSRNGDLEFQSDKNFRFIWSGIFSLPNDFLFELCKMEIANRNKQIQKIILKSIKRML